MSFMRVFDTRFRDFEVRQVFNGVFVYSASNSDCDGNKKVGFPSMVL